MRSRAAISGARDIPDLIRLIYSSQPFGYDDGMLAGILLDARRCNIRDGVTGALVCRQDIYLQFLEGPARQVQATYARIRRDDRHVDVTLRLSQKASARMFGEWAMLHDPATSWTWSPEEISRDILDRTGEAEFTQVFEDIAAATRTAEPG